MTSREELIAILRYHSGDTRIRVTVGGVDYGIPESITVKDRYKLVHAIMDVSRCQGISLDEAAKLVIPKLFPPMPMEPIIAVDIIPGRVEEESEPVI